MKIGNNFIFESPYISTFTVQFDLLDNITSLPGLLDPNSQMFQTYSQEFCQEVRSCYSSKCSNTVKFLNFLMPENFSVIYLKFKKRGQTSGYFVKKMQME